MTRGRFFSLLLFFGLVLSGPVPAPSWSADFSPRACDAMDRGETGRVVYVDDGDTVRLDSGTRVRLVGLQAPKLPLGRKGFTAWPLGTESRDELIRLVQGRTVTLFSGGRQQDRHGRALAHLFREPDGLWIQGEMIRTGMARTYSFPDNRTCVPDLLALEETARSKGRGIWALDHYQVRNAGLLPEQDLRDRFELVEGRIVDVAQVGKRTYMNFGADYRTDFTVVLENRDRRSPAMTGFPFDRLEGQKVRIRGWIYERNGPMIKLTHPEQMEFLDAP